MLQRIIGIVFTFHAVPLTPSGFNFTRNYYTVMDNTVTFEWDPPESAVLRSVNTLYSATPVV